jgi:hypothetical protein
VTDKLFWRSIYPDYGSRDELYTERPHHPPEYGPSFRRGNVLLNPEPLLEYQSGAACAGFECPPGPMVPEAPPTPAPITVQETRFSKKISFSQNRIRSPNQRRAICLEAAQKDVWDALKRLMPAKASFEATSPLSARKNHQLLALDAS